MWPFWFIYDGIILLLECTEGVLYMLGIDSVCQVLSGCAGGTCLLGNSSGDAY